MREFADLTGLKPDDLCQELRDTALAIRKTLVVENVLEPGMKKPVRRHGSWFEYVDEALGDGYVTIKLSSWLKPFLIQVRLELGAAEVNQEGKIVKENLAAYKHFKNKAISPAVKEINQKTDISVAYKEEKVKGSKAVASLTFQIRDNLETSRRCARSPSPKSRRWNSPWNARMTWRK